MTKRIVIVGAGGFGREVHGWISSSPRWWAEHGNAEVVFIDDRASVPVRGSIVASVEEFEPQDGDTLICAIGSPEARRNVVRQLSARGAEFGTFVHDSVVIGDAVSLARGVIVCPGSVLTSDISLAEHVHVNTNCNIGHDVVVSEYATLSSACNLTGGVVIGEGAFLATAVSIIPGRRIGAGAYVGVGSVVIRNVPDGVTVFGNPSRVIGRKSS